jgi:predicted O-methyltransferase YrrM
MGKYFRKKYPKFYKVYQEIIGEVYYEFICLGVIFRLIALKRLKRLENLYGDPIDVRFNFSWLKPYNFDSFQNEFELRDFFNFLGEKKFNVICEIGTDNGGTLYLWSKILKPGGLIISVDLAKLYRKSINRFLRRIFPKEQQVYFIREDSHTSICVEKLVRILKEKKIDFLFIDGDHSYDGVKQDFSDYSKFVKKGGIIAFHDISVTELPENICGVFKFWNEIKMEYKYKEIIGEKDGIGIGLIFV